MALVLAVEPDIRQATTLKRIVREHVRADLVIADSRDGAIAALGARIPDVVLITALLSPRDEEELIAYLRTLPGAHHIQTHTIPQLASSPEDLDQKGGKGLFGKLRRKKESEQLPMGGCDPELFADEIKTFIERATERNHRRSTTCSSASLTSSSRRRGSQPSPRHRRRRHRGNGTRSPAHRVEQSRRLRDHRKRRPSREAVPAGPSSWDDPFAWRPASVRTDASPSASASPHGGSGLITNVPIAVQAEDQEVTGEATQRQREQEAEAERQRQARGRGGAQA